MTHPAGVPPESVLGPLNDFERRYLPEQLFLAGDQSLLQSRPRVSIVGARRATDDGIRRAVKLARILVRHNVIVVSGLAAGVDTAAHQAAMDAGGRTIAVIGTPLDISYPRQNWQLQDRIAREHLVVSQYPPGHPTLRANFPRRNRTMALIVDASVIVEASDTSGSLSQGWEALRLNRELFIMRSILDQAELRWPKDMRQYGALVLDDPPEALLDSLPYGAPLAALSL